MIILSINESLFCIPHNCTGVVSVCNNKYGNKLSCIGPNNNNKTSLNIGDSILIKLITLEGSDLKLKFITPNFHSEKTVKDDRDVYGFKVCINYKNICMPFIDGGATTFVVTVNKGVVYVDAGAIISNNILLDYYHSEMNIGDEICVTLKKLDFISPPIRERYRTSCAL